MLLFHQNTQNIQENPFLQTRTNSAVAVIDILYRIQELPWPHKSNFRMKKNGEKLPVHV